MAKTKLNFDQMGVILSEIAERARKVELLTTACLDTISNVEQADALGSAAIDMAQRIGWLADFAASQTPGLSPYVGGAEQWMLPERFRHSVDDGGFKTVEG